MQLVLEDFGDIVTVKKVKDKEGIYQQHIGGKPTTTYFRRKGNGKHRWEWCFSSKPGKLKNWCSVGSAKMIRKKKE